MEDEMILNRPTDRRLVGEDSDLPPGPPGVESEAFESAQKQEKPIKKRRKSPQSRSIRSPSSRNRRSTSRGHATRSGNRETPNYGRDYSPPPRRFQTAKRGRSREHIRSPDRSRNRSRDRRRDRRDRSRSTERYRNRRSRSRSTSPRSRRWSPGKKPASPPLPPSMNAGNPYGMQPTYADTYAPYPTQYAQQYPGAEYCAPPPPPSFTTAYPPPPAWGMPVPAPEEYTQTAPWPTAPVPAPQQAQESGEEQMKRDAAVAQEVQNQRDQLKKQRNDYLKRAAGLKRELKTLKDQRNDLASGQAPPSPTTKGFLEKNDILQSQIQKKLNTIENVIDMLSGIIGEVMPVATPSPSSHKKSKKKKNDSDDDSSPERLKTKVIESIKTKRTDNKQKDNLEQFVKAEKQEKEVTLKKKTDSNKQINYTFYDPEMHWCQVCEVFPKTAKDYLNHLHSKDHAANVQTIEAPWHDFVVQDEFPNYPNIATKRTPIRGLQFFVPSTAWFCKLCNFWMGDLHCASAHLKSKTHSEKYSVFIDQNPHFEVDWMAERQKTYDQQRAPPPPPQITSVSTSGMDLLESIPLQINTQKKIDKLEKIESEEKGLSKKRKKKMEEKKDKKKKRKVKKRKKSSSSSSSSSSDSTSDSESAKKIEEERSNSIRVAMRNLSKTHDQMTPDMRGKWTTIQEGELLEPVPPPPPTIIAPDPEDHKKDELMMSQWNTPQPIISESEKKLLEELKGKLKSKPSVEDKKKESSNGVSKKEQKKFEREQPLPFSVVKEQRRSQSVEKNSGSVSKNVDRNVEKRSKSREKRSRSRRRSGSRNKVIRRSSSRNRGMRRSRSRGRRSHSRNRRSRSRGRFNNRGRGKRSRSRDRRSLSRDRRSRSRGRRRRSRSMKRRSRSYGRRTYSRSRSRSSSHRIEKPIVRYPEFRPRVPEIKKVTKTKAEDETERKKTPPAKKAQQQSATGKKLPFIGRMPVFKKQTPGGEDKKEEDLLDPNQMEEMHMGYDHFDGMGMMMDYDDLMPDPMQYVTLMGAPPPPPPTGGPPTEYVDDKEMLPPGIDETDADLVPKPISDAPIPRKGPLPKDFQEALNIIFPGDEKKTDDENALESSKSKEVNNPSEVELIPNKEVSNEVNGNSHDIVNNEDETSQVSAGEPFIGFPPSTFSEQSQELADPIALVGAIPPPPPPPPPEEDLENEQKDKGSDEKRDKHEMSPTDSEKLRRQEELDDLALLGIDADDLAAQCM